MLSKDVFLVKLKLVYGEDGLDYDRIMAAYDFGKMAHEGQVRKSGEPYFVHPIEVALILSELKMDTDTIISGLLHDVIEDTVYTFDDISQRFGEPVAKLVDGVTKLGKVKYRNSEEFETENLRKMFLAMAEDIRVILIKLSDRLHNIRTLMFMKPEKQVKIARETLEVYAPIAHRLGIFKIKWELEDTCLSYIEPQKYKQILNLVNQKKIERERDIEVIVSDLRKALANYKPDAEIYGRPKNYYSIYRKMFVQKRNFDEIFDITAVRIIVDTQEECWGVLGIVHSLWTPIQGRLKDYISVPKANMYRSLHTTVLGKIGKPFEVQIRTREMHQMAEYGIAAHWKYKSGGKSSFDNEKMLDEKLVWLRQIIEDEENYESSKDFVDSMKFEIVSSKVYVTTPMGKVIELPAGSTPVDFAYKIHSDVGNRCIGAKVDGRIVPLNFILENGKIVEIITSKNSGGPSRDWLTFVKSSMAKNKIKNWFKKQNREDNIEKGREMLEREVVRNGFKPLLLNEVSLQNEIITKLSAKTMDDVYASIGYGGILTNQVIPKIRRYYKNKMANEFITDEQELKTVDKRSSTKEIKSEKGIIVDGIGGTYVKLAKCCSPVKGDDIIGFITRGKGVTVHQPDCPNLDKSEEARRRYIPVRWSDDEKVSYVSEIQITAYDQKGLLTQISLMMSEANIGINGVNARKTSEGIAIIRLGIEIDNKEQLDSVIRKFRAMEGVIDVRRTLQ